MRCIHPKITSTTVATPCSDLPAVTIIYAIFYCSATSIAADLIGGDPRTSMTIAISFSHANASITTSVLLDCASSSTAAAVATFCSVAEVAKIKFTLHAGSAALTMLALSGGGQRMSTTNAALQRRRSDNIYVGLTRWCSIVHDSRLQRWRPANVDDSSHFVPRRMSGYVHVHLAWHFVHVDDGRPYWW